LDSLDDTRTVDRHLVHELVAARDRATAGRDNVLFGVRKHLFPRVPAARYTLDAVLGAGGMGVVYRGFDRKLGRAVAVKLLRSGIGDRLLRERDLGLRQEARSMAQLRHPNVATVFDVGVFGHGPTSFVEEAELEPGVFIVMELVTGTSLALWLRMKTRSVEQIVATVIDAGRGLAAAHDAGIFHRDFKPGNVMVGTDGRCRVVDFGLAICSAPETTERMDWSVTGPESRSRELVGTPAYLAPELMYGAPPTQASDQWAFCVTLFEALYRRRPHEGEDRDQLMRAICSGDIVWPRRSERVDRGLHRILMRGLSMRPERRFASMHALLAALEAWRRPKRRRLATVAVALGLGLATTATAIDAPMTPRENGAASTAAVSWSPDDEERRYDDSERVRRLDAIEAMLHSGQFDRALAAAASLARWARSHGDHQSSAHAEVLSGRALALSERRDEALETLERAYLDASARGVPRAARDAAIARAGELIADGNLEEARNWSARARAEASRLEGGVDAHIEARLVLLQARISRRADWCVRSLDQLTQLPLAKIAASDTELATQVHLASADAAICLGDLDSARNWIDEAEHYARKLGPEHPMWAHIETAEAQLALKQHDPERAVTVLRTSETRLDRTFGTNHPLTIQASCSLGHALVSVGRLREAEDRLEPCYRARRERLGQDRLEVARAARTLGIIANDKLAFADAERYMRDAYDGYRVGLGNDPDEVGYTALLLAGVESSLGRCRLAMSHSAEAIEALEGAPAFRRAAASYVRANMARTCRRDSTADLERALAILDAEYGGESPEPVPVSSLRGEILLDLGRPARAVLERSLEAVEREGGVERVAEAQWALARAIATEQPRRARRLARLAREVFARDKPLLLLHIDSWLVHHWPSWAKQHGFERTESQQAIGSVR